LPEEQEGSVVGIEKLEALGDEPGGVAAMAGRVIVSESARVREVGREKRICLPVSSD
jgi:hypothetical protein